MVKLTYGDFRNDEFARALSKVMHHTGYKSTKISSDIAKLIREYKKELEIVQDLFQKALKKHAKLDEKGNFEPDKDKDGKPVRGTYCLKEDLLEDWKVAIKEFNATDVELPAHPIHLEDLDGVALSPGDLDALRPLITECPRGPLAPVKNIIKPAADPAPAH
jgi:hypothetical protein